MHSETFLDYFLLSIRTKVVIFAFNGWQEQRFILLRQLIVVVCRRYRNHDVKSCNFLLFRLIGKVIITNIAKFGCVKTIKKSGIFNICDRQFFQNGVSVTDFRRQRRVLPEDLVYRTLLENYVLLDLISASAGKKLKNRRSTVSEMSCHQLTVWVASLHYRMLRRFRSLMHTTLNGKHM